MVFVGIRHSELRILPDASDARPGEEVIPISRIDHLRTEDREPPTQFWLVTTANREFRVRDEKALDTLRKVLKLIEEQG